MERQSIEESLEVLLGGADSPSRSPLSIKRGRGRGRKTQAKKKPGPARGRNGTRAAVKKNPRKGNTPSPPSEEDDSDDDLFEILKSDDSPNPSPRASPSPDDESEEEESAPEDPPESELEDPPESDPEDPPESEPEDPPESEPEDPNEEEDDSDPPESEDDSDRVDPNEEDDISVTSNKILPITPKRFTVSTPRTPSERLDRIKKKRRPGNFLDHLKEFRYSLLRFVYIDEELCYIVCYDPYGQIVFVSCESVVEDDLKENVSRVDVVKLKTVPEEVDNPLDESFVNVVKECVDMGVFGIVFYNGEDYQICERNKRGYFKDRYCKLKNHKKTDRLRLPQSFIVVNSEDIFEEPLETIETNKVNYENIQRQQLSSSKHTFKEIVESMKRLNRIIVDFDKVYQDHSKGIMKDLDVMAKHSHKMYQKYSNQELDDEGKSKFDLLSLNRFLRGQFNIQKDEMMDRLYSIKEYLDKSELIIETAIDEIAEKGDQVIGKLVERDEIDKYI